MRKRMGKMKDVKVVNQSGRSLLEIIAVVAIMAILSIGAIAIYQRVMNAHKADALYSDIRLRAVLNTEGKSKYISPGNEGKSTYDIDLNVFWNRPTSGYFTIAAEGIPSDLCRHLLKKDWLDDGGTNNDRLKASRIYLNGTPYEPNDLPKSCPNGSVVFSVTYRSGKVTPTTELPSRCNSQADCEGCRVCTSGECLPGCPNGQICHNDACVPGSCVGSLCCPDELDFCEDGQDPNGDENHCACIVPKQCSECDEECGVCNRLTGVCEKNNAACPQNKPYCGDNGTCGECAGLTGASGAYNNQCKTCAELDANTNYAKGDCRRCSNWIDAGNGYCRPCNYKVYIGGDSYEDVLKCPNRVYKSFYPNRKNWYCDPEYSQLNEAQTECTKIKDCPAGKYWMAGSCWDCSWGEPWYSLSDAEAARCQGYIWLESGRHVYQSCAVNGSATSSYSECFSCTSTLRYWSTTDGKCYKTCPDGRTPNATTRKCGCPEGSFAGAHDPDVCCSGLHDGKDVMGTTDYLNCGCPSGAVTASECSDSGLGYDSSTCQCQCPAGQIPFCQAKNTSTGACLSYACGDENGTLSDWAGPGSTSKYRIMCPAGQTPYCTFATGSSATSYGCYEVACCAGRAISADDKFVADPTEGKEGECLVCPTGTATTGQGGTTTVTNQDGSVSLTCYCPKQNQQWTGSQCVQYCSSYTTNECGLGYFCKPNGTVTKASGGQGTCTDVNTISATNWHGHWYIGQTSWWAGMSWCIGKGKSGLMTAADMIAFCQETGLPNWTTSNGGWARDGYTCGNIPEGCGYNVGKDCSRGGAGKEQQQRPTICAAN